MNYNEKKSLYESIMKEVAKTVKRQINEAAIQSLAPLNYYNFKDSIYYINKLIKEQKNSNKGVFIELPDKLEDLEMAYKYTFRSIFGEQILKISGTGLDSHDFESELDNIKKHRIVFIEDAENVKRDAWPLILNLIDGQIREEKFNCTVILCGTKNPMSEKNPIRQRFINLKIYH